MRSPPQLPLLPVEMLPCRRLTPPPAPVSSTISSAAASEIAQPLSAENPLAGAASMPESKIAVADAAIYRGVVEDFAVNDKAKPF